MSRQHYDQGGDRGGYANRDRGGYNEPRIRGGYDNRDQGGYNEPRIRGGYDNRGQGDYNAPRERGGYDNSEHTPRGRGYNEPPPRDVDRGHRGQGEPRYASGPPRDYDRGHGGQQSHRGQGRGSYDQQQQRECDDDRPPRGQSGAGRGSPKSKANVEETLEKLREKLQSRGVCGIKGFGRMFRLYDDNGDHKVCREEFEEGLKDYGLDLSKDEVDSLMATFDRDGCGTIDFDELLSAVRPPMSKARVKLIEMAFQKMDKTGDGFITPDELKGLYNARHHPKYKNGEWTEKQVFTEFLNQFESDNDGKVTLEEFTDYYRGVSVSIDKDVYFDLMMRNSWKI